MDSREDLKPTLCVLLSRFDQAERIDPKAFPVMRPETHLERIPDKDEVTSSILVSPTGTPASAGVLLFLWGFPTVRFCMSFPIISWPETLRSLGFVDPVQKLSD